MDHGQLGDIHATRRAAGGARLRPALGGGWILVLWGSLWLAGSLLQLAGSPWVAPFWTAAVPLGIAFSFWLGVRMKQFVRAHWGLQLAGFWGLWVLFGVVWLALFVPTPATPAGVAFIVSLVAFGLSVSGLLVSRALVAAGLVLLAVDLWVYLAAPQAFHWAMVALGAAILGAGIWLVRWKPASTS